MEENFQARIGADIRDFQRRMEEVDQTIRETATGADADIGADIAEFMAEMATVNEIIDEIARDHEVDIDANIAEFNAQIAEVENAINDIAHASPTVNVDANTRRFTRQAAEVRAVAHLIGNHRPTVTVDADTAGATSRIMAMLATLRAITARDIVIEVRARWKNYQRVMGAIASFSRNVGEVMAMTARGITISMSPAIVPILASVVGLLGQLGPMLGVIGGSTFALASSFGAAGIGVAGFAAVAIPSIGGVIESATELKELEEKIAKADTWKERNKLMKEHSEILSGMSDAQADAHKSLTAFKDDYSKLVKDMENPVLDVFASALQGISGVLKLARPMIENVTTSIQKMMDTFNANLKAEDTKAFFRFLEDYAGPALEAVGGAIGNFTMGLFNMMEEFGPLSTETQNGFLKMSESFRNWTASLSENKKFQSFVDYVSENMPKIRNIFGDAFKGIINTFAAFAPSSATMMTGLQDMMARFKEWSSTLGENQGFKNFVDYFMTNGPKVLDAIGNITTFIINLGKALAPAGSQIMDIANSVLNFTNRMLENHPWIGKIIAGLVVFGGAFLAILPNVVALNALLGGLITKLILSTAKTIWAATMQVAKWVWMGVQATVNAIKIAAAWAWSTGVAMVTAVAKMIASAAIFVAKWLWMGVQAGLHALKVAAAWTLSTGIAMVTAVAKMTATAAIFVAKWLWMGVQAGLHALKVAAAWTLSTGVAMATAVASMIATSAVFVAKWVWMGVQSLLAATRMAAAWFIALGPVGWVIGLVVGLAILIIANWDKISAWTQKTWSTVSTWISTKWSEIKAKTTEAASNIWNTVKEKFTSIVSSIQEKMSSAKQKISSKWEEIKSAASSKLAQLVTTVGTFFTNLVSKVREKMTEAVNKVKEKVGEMPGKVRSYVGDMLSAGADLIRGLIDGAVGMASDAISAVKTIAGDMVDAALSYFKIKSPSRVFMEMGAFVSEGLAIGVQNKAKMAVDNVTRMASAMTSAFNPQMELANMSASASLDTSVSRADMGVVRHAFAAEMDSVEQSEPAIYVHNELVGDKIITHVNRGNSKQSRITDGFYGK